MFVKLRHLQLVFSLTLVSTLIAEENSYEDEEELFAWEKICVSRSCERAGNEIIKSVNESINPCDDFYQHSCDGWIKSHPDTPELYDANQLKVLQLKLQSELTDILEDNEPPENEVMRKVKDYYHSCKDLDAIDAADLNPLEAIVSENGGWPLVQRLNKWNLNDKNLTFQKIHGNYAKLAARSALFVIGVVRNRLKSDGYTLQLQPPKLFPMYAVNKNSPFVPQIKNRDFDRRLVKYSKYIIAVAEEFIRFQGYSVLPEQIKKDLWEMIVFETAVAELYLDEMKRYYDNNSVAQSMTIQQVQNIWNKAISGHPEFQIDWLKTIRSNFEGTDISIDSTEKIELMSVNFLVKLGYLLKISTLRTVVNYVHWYGIDGLARYSNKQMRKNKQSAYRNTSPYNEDDETQRPLYCINHHKMLEGLSYAYIKKNLPQYLWSFPTTLVKEIEEELKWQIHLSSWLDKSAKDLSKKKIDDMIKNLQYQDWFDDPKKIENYYNELIVGKNYFKNVVNYNRFEMIQTMKKLRQPYNRTDDILSFLPIKVHSFYDQDTNSMNIPAAFFQPPIFDSHRPPVMNFGSLGFIIGHEMAHGFENQDVKYNKLASKNQLWSQSTMNLHRRKSQCFIDQYNNYTLMADKTNKTIKVNGVRTLEENIADHIGATVALNAYTSYKDANHVEDIRLRLLYTHTDLQLFFYSFSNHFCASLGPQSLENYRTSQHNTFRVRVNGVVSNMPEFARAFSCPSGSPMNPVKKCTYWK